MFEKKSNLSENSRAGKIPESILNILKETLIDHEKILYFANADYSLKGNYEKCGLAVTNKRIISIDSTHKNGILAIFLNKIEKCEIDNMYGNSIIQVEFDGKLLDINRFSYSCDEQFNEAKNRILNIAGLKEEIKDSKVQPAEKSYHCPKCNRILNGPNAVCINCIDKRKVISRLLEYVKPFLKETIVLLSIAVLMTIISLLPPYLTKILLDDVFPNSNLKKLWGILIIILAVYSFNSVLSGIRAYIMRKFNQNIIFNMRTQVFNKTQKLGMDYFDKRSTGSIMSRISTDTQRLQNFLKVLTQDIIIQALTIIGIMIIMAGMHWQLALITLAPIPVVVAASKIYASKMKPRYRRIWAGMSNMNATLSETITGIKVIKAFTSEKKVSRHYEEQGESLVARHMEAAKISSIYSPFINLLVMLGTYTVWGLGGYWVITGNNILSIGVLIAFISYAARFYAPVTFFANFNDTFQQAITSAERVFEILDADPEPDFGKGKIPDKITGKMEFINVSFYYEKGVNVLSDINFSVNPSETIGIVGSTGSGKSTLVNLILRYYDVKEGQILLDNNNITDIDKNYLRNSIGYVLQEPLLFKDTIANNIAYSKPDASIYEVIEASKIANAHDFILKMPDAYETVLGERGTGLSGGEKQRISIARAIIKNPKLLVLDEATSAVDTETEKLIQDAIDRLIKNRTTFIIAHRLSTLNKASRILVLEDGQLLEFGTHDELMKKKGRFYNLVKMQDVAGSDIIKYN